MVSIRLLGGFDLGSVSGERSGRLGSKPKGIIAFLAVSRGTAISREKLVGLLWGGHGEANARHSLRQALTSVRSALGQKSQDVLQSSEDGVCLRSEGIDLDVEKFEQMARSSEPTHLREACSLYRGEFLAGLEVREPEFEEWMLSERYRLSDLAESAFCRLMNLQMAAGDSKAVVDTARELIKISPFNDQAHARLIASYGALGQLGLAEAHHKRCCDLFHREIDRNPGEEVKLAIAEARALSHRITALDNINKNGADPSAIGDRSGRRLVRISRSKWLVAAAGVVLLLIVSTLVIQNNRIGFATSTPVVSGDLPDKPSIAVLPFDSLAQDPQRVILARGLTNDIITDLSKFSHLTVISGESSSRFADREDTTKDVAQKLGVRYVLDGSLQLRDDKIAVHVNLVDGITGRHIWSERFNRPKEELFAIQKDVAETIAGVIGSEFGELRQAEIERMRRIPTTDLHAYGLLIRGIEHFWKVNRDDNIRARQMFQNALDADPDYALAMAFISLTYVWDVFQGWSGSREDSLQRAETLARRAIATDPTEPKGYVALGSVYQARARRDEAISLFETAYSLNPNDFRINEALAFSLTYGGSADRGVEIMEDAQILNPYHTADPLMLAWSYFYAHRYEEALNSIHKVKYRSVDYWTYKAAILAQLGDKEEAKHAVGEALKLDPDLTLQKQHEERLASGLVPQYADFMVGALGKAGLQ